MAHESGKGLNIMASGGKRKGAGAPYGNTNALKHGGRARVLYGVPLNKELSRFEYKALCLVQMENLKYLEEETCGSVEASIAYIRHKTRYIGAIEFNERRNKSRLYRYDNYLYKQLGKAIKEMDIS